MLVYCACLIRGDFGKGGRGRGVVEPGTWSGNPAVMQDEKEHGSVGGNPSQVGNDKEKVGNHETINGADEGVACPHDPGPETQADCVFAMIRQTNLTEDREGTADIDQNDKPTDNGFEIYQRVLPPWEVSRLAT